MKIHYVDSLTGALDVLYQLARENCLSPRKMYVIREVTANWRVAMGAVCGFICIEPRAKHQPRCGNDLALAALSRSVSPFLPLLPSSSPLVPLLLVASLRQELSDFLGCEYAALVDVRGWRRRY